MRLRKRGGGFSIKELGLERIESKTFWDRSLLPPTKSQNAFSTRLGKHGFDFYSMFVVDLLHEMELGVWKSTFTHLLRILIAQVGDHIVWLNERYRLVPPFGRTIRSIITNPSEMKKLAARDFEDLLQCAIPVFDGLMEDGHNKIIVDLLFELATWHGFAKLRLHTKSTLSALGSSTARLGVALRKFSNVTCKEFVTKELPKETAARGRRRVTLAKATKSRAVAELSGKKQWTGSSTRSFNLQTSKLHALGDYVETIRLFGPTDGYSTQTGELLFELAT